MWLFAGSTLLGVGKSFVTFFEMTLFAAADLGAQADLGAVSIFARSRVRFAAFRTLTSLFEFKRHVHSLVVAPVTCIL